jgi:hypothetical protein
VEAETFKHQHKTYAVASPSNQTETDDLLASAVDRYKRRNAPFLSTKTERDQLSVLVKRLVEAYELDLEDAVDHLKSILSCSRQKRCWRVLCPACRSIKQEHATKKMQQVFGDCSCHELKFMTLLLPIEKDASAIPDGLQVFRDDLHNRLRNNRKGLNAGLPELKIVGAYEIDLKNPIMYQFASTDSRELMRYLGYDTSIQEDQYMPHIHAIVGPLNDEREAALKALIEKSLGAPLISGQLQMKSLHSNKSKDVNLTTLARYMYKGRMQYCDNNYRDKDGQKRTTYGSPYPARSVTEFLNMLDEIQNFKGLRFEYGTSSKSARFN